MVVFSKEGRVVSVYVNRNQRCTRYLLHKSRHMEMPYMHKKVLMHTSHICKAYKECVYTLNVYMHVSQHIA